MFGRGLNPPIYFVYLGDIMMLFMSWCAAAYVVYKTVDSAVSHSEGFYHIYGGYSSTGNLMGLFEVLAVINMILWSFVIVILSIVAGAELWRLMDERYYESLQHVAGDETPLTWDKSVRNFFLCVIAGFGAMIAGGSLGAAIEKVIAFFDKYDGITSKEACDGSSGTCPDGRAADADGTAVIYDILYHLTATFYGEFVLSVVSWGGYIFMLGFMGFDDEFDCEFVDGIDQSHYLPLFAEVVKMNNYDDCMAGGAAFFPLLDLNGDGFVTRCEDAQFQFLMGETREYSMKFSAPFTPGGLGKVCGKLFPFY